MNTIDRSMLGDDGGFRYHYCSNLFSHIAPLNSPLLRHISIIHTRPGQRLWPVDTVSVKRFAAKHPDSFMS